MTNGLPPMKKMLETNGKVVEITRKSIFTNQYIYVLYSVGGQPYTTKERIRFAMRAIKIRGLYFGQKQYQLLGNVKIGDVVRVHYLEWSPHLSYLPDNINWDGLLRR